MSDEHPIWEPLMIGTVTAIVTIVVCVLVIIWYTF